MNKKIDIPINIKNVLSVLYENGFEAFLVGGCVRDFILGKVPYDFDITTMMISAGLLVSTVSHVPNMFQGLGRSF